MLHLSGLATPLVLSVHSIVSWDFAMSIVPGWHATIFAPYFVAGAIFGGFAMVVVVMVPVRRIFRLEPYITDYHFENMSRFILFTSIICGYAYGAEYFIAWYSAVEFEQTSFWQRAFMWCDFAWDVERLPDPKRLMAELHREGFHNCLWINPYVSCQSALYQEGVRGGGTGRRARPRR